MIQNTWARASPFCFSRSSTAGCSATSRLCSQNGMDPQHKSVSHQRSTLAVKELNISCFVLARLTEPQAQGRCSDVFCSAISVLCSSRFVGCFELLVDAHCDGTALPSLNDLTSETFNAGLFACVVIGLAIGHHIFLYKEGSSADTGHCP